MDMTMMMLPLSMHINSFRKGIGKLLHLFPTSVVDVEGFLRITII